ncbi:MAG: undecaprenyldiphospho-muramoylpentapeptide beta-N-acetylglucosaminyltransferase [Deltaproteobacteria bacterium]|nr:undecaprenyldiphospho-muramoylpentapeptide beta-N-acetylglucosaminyltransferase [Deltaproteobacteria bacterium]
MSDVTPAAETIDFAEGWERARDEPRVLVAAGGTGGHVVPAASLCEELKKLRPQTKILFVGVGRQAEADILDPLGYERAVLQVPQLAGKSPFRALGSVFGLLKAQAGAMDLVRKFKPDLCLAFGGYVCGPAGLAAKMFGVPLVLHEQNSSPGLTNRWLAMISDLVMLGFEEAAGKFSTRKIVFSGNPVRESISRIGAEKPEINLKKPCLLIVGGSQGSKRLNAAALELAADLRGRGIDFRVVHQTGAGAADETAESYRDLGVDARVSAFITDMAGRYLEADLAVTRAGALTLAEQAAAGVPAVLVPLPTAAGDHQTVNALAVEARGAAKVVRESELERGLLSKTVLELLGSPDKLPEMARRARESGAGAGQVGARMARLALAAMARGKYAVRADAKQFRGGGGGEKKRG